MKETDRKISRLGSRIGDLIEELIFPNIVEKFNKETYLRQISKITVVFSWFVLKLKIAAE
jgi:hypothetical protein